MNTTTLFVYCDNHNTRVAVTDFTRTDGQWSEIGHDSSVRVTTGAQSGRGIVLLGPENRRVDVYRLYDLRCRKRKCARSVLVRGDKLARCLDDVAAAGDSSVSLAKIAASI